MEVVLAEAMGWCFGVRDAVSFAMEHPHREDLTIVGELVHDDTVLAALSAAGLRFVRSADEPILTRHVLITAHGASRAAIGALSERGFVVHEATCPLVHRAHARLERFVAEGLHPVVIGRHAHVEVLGLIGDHPGASVLACPEDAALLPDRAGYGVVVQTTQVLAQVLDIVAAVRAARPGSLVRFADTICQPTKERQAAVRRLAAQVERVVVVGGKRSHNAQRLAETCRAMGICADLVQGADEIEPRLYVGLTSVGVTAATSAPDGTIAGVVARLKSMHERKGEAGFALTGATRSARGA